MPEFVPVLIAAVFLLVLLLVAFSGPLLVVSDGGNRSKTITLGEDLTVMYVEGTTELTSLGGEVSAGLVWGQSQTSDFTVPDYEDVSEGIIILNVTDSNYYGSLMVSVNGRQVYSGVPKMGEQTIIFDPDDLGFQNTVSVDAESSGWKIWAPNIYVFNATVSANYVGKQTQSLSFDLSSAEVSGATRARLLIFLSRSGSGELLASLNGRQISSGVSTVYTDFALDNLKVGENVLDLSTERNTVYNITSAQIVLFF